MAQPGIMVCMFVEGQFMRGVLVRIVIPLVLGFSWLCMWKKDILGLYFLFKVSISLSSEWDSTVHMRAMSFLDTILEIIFHLFIVDGLLTPFIFKEAMFMCPILLWDGVEGLGAVMCTRLFTEPMHWSLWPWVMAGSRPAHGRWGILIIFVCYCIVMCAQYMTRQLNYLCHIHCVNLFLIVL